MNDSNTSSTPESATDTPPAEVIDAALQQETKRPHKAPWLRQFQWQKGQSGNARGKRQGERSVTAALKRCLSRGETADAIARRLVDAAMSGDMTATKIILDRCDGLLTRQLEAHISGSVAMPTVQNVIFQIPDNHRQSLPVTDIPHSLDAATLPPQLPDNGS